jgi:hypothetical protein
LQSVGDARIELEETPREPVVAVPLSPGVAPRLIAGAIAVIASARAPPRGLRGGSTLTPRVTRYHHPAFTIINTGDRDDDSPRRLERGLH